MAEQTRAGEIHDIGYRRYDGARLGPRYIRRALYVDTLRGAFGLGRSPRSKVMPWLLLSLAVLPAVAIGIVTGYFGFPELPIEYPGYVGTIQSAVTIFVGAQAPVVMSRDLRFRVASLYFSRPLSRQQYVQAKYAAMSTALFLLMALPVTLLLAGALLAELPVREQLPDYLRAMAAVVLHALVLGGLGLLIASLTPRRGLGVAAVVGVLLVLAGLHGAVRGLASEFGHTTLEGYSGLLSPYPLVDGVVSSLTGAEASFGEGPPGALGTAVFVALTVLIVAGSYAGLVARYRKALS